MSFINPITDLNLTYELSQTLREDISKNQENLEHFLHDFIFGIQDKLESNETLSDHETEFLLNLLNNIYDNGVDNGDEYLEIEVII